MFFKRKSKPAVMRRLSESGTPITAWPRTEDYPGLDIEAVCVDVPAGGFYVDVVGESYNQTTLTIAARGKSPDGAYKPDHLALLMPEPFNPYDPNAVRVFLSMGQVGHLSRADAVAYRPSIDFLASRGEVLAARAALTGGWDRGSNDSGSFGVRLYMGSPAQVLAELTDDSPSAGEWRPDPSGRHERRYWDGSAWTDLVTDDGSTSRDVL